VLPLSRKGHTDPGGWAPHKNSGAVWHPAVPFPWLPLPCPDDGTLPPEKKKRLKFPYLANDKVSRAE